MSIIFLATLALFVCAVDANSNIGKHHYTHSYIAIYTLTVASYFEKTDIIHRGSDFMLDFHN